jgi:aminoglycoside N3'-acetyltransferase
MNAVSGAVQALTDDLVTLGVRSGRDLLVHCSMRRVGPVPGGAATVLCALRIALGADATLVVPTQTAGNSLTSEAYRSATAGLDARRRAEYIAAMPGFDPANSPSIGMGALAEQVRTAPGAVRSAHPQSSFAAIGPRATESMAGHELTCHLGENSPLGWLYRTDADILLLGVDYTVCTAFHLAEYRLPEPSAHRLYQCFTATSDGRKEQSFTDIHLDAGDFGMLGARIDDEPFVNRAMVGAARSRLLPIRAAVDFAVAWRPFAQRRGRGVTI